MMDQNQRPRQTRGAKKKAALTKIVMQVMKDRKEAESSRRTRSKPNLIIQKKCKKEN
jgi:hypothetical protein